MRFRVTGQNRDTGARQTIEFTAESRAAAERKALQSGMTVNRVDDISDGEGDHTGVTPGGSQRRRIAGTSPYIKLIGLIIVVAVIYYLWSHGILRPGKR